MYSFPKHLSGNDQQHNHKDGANGLILDPAQKK
jgi:hypothetical protein